VARGTYSGVREPVKTVHRRAVDRRAAKAIAHVDDAGREASFAAWPRCTLLLAPSENLALSARSSLPGSIHMSATLRRSTTALAKPRPTLEPSSRVDEAAVRSLAAAIHRELRESLEPEDVVRLASELLGRVADELRDRREASGG
jgi:hypothetical protein